MLPRVPAGRRAATELAEAWCRTTSWEKKRRRAEVGPADRNGEQQRVRGGSRSADSCAKALIWDGERERERDPWSVHWTIDAWFLLYE